MTIRKNFDQPYLAVYTKLKELRDHKHPLKKMKVIYEAKTLIADCIDAHYAQLGTEK